jgi:seryl-tRNA synthetase
MISMRRQLSGARFVSSRALADSTALGAFMLDLPTASMVYEVNPPIMVKDGALFGTANCRNRETFFRRPTTSG